MLLSPALEPSSCSANTDACRSLCSHAAITDMDACRGPHPHAAIAICIGAQLVPHWCGYMQKSPLSCSCRRLHWSPCLCTANACWYGWSLAHHCWVISILSFSVILLQVMGVWLYQVWLYCMHHRTPKYWVWHLSSDWRSQNIFLAWKVAIQQRLFHPNPPVWVSTFSSNLSLESGD